MSRDGMELQITGLDELEKRLGQLPERVSKRLLGNASRAGARVIRDQAKRNVPVRTGALRNAIRVQGKRLRGGSYRARVGIRSTGRAFVYGRFLEEGAGAHTIRARRKGGRRGARGFLSIGGIVRRKVRHPGVRARHWMRRAARDSSQRAIDKFGDNILRGLDREIAKLGPGAGPGGAS